MEELYGYCPNVEPLATSSSSGQRDRRRFGTLKGENDEINDSNATHNEKQPVKKKRKYVSQVESSSNALLNWLNQQEQNRKEEQKEKLKVLKEMHDEKMGMLRELMGVLKK